MPRVQEPATTGTDEQRDLLARAMQEPDVAQAMRAYERIAAYLPQPVVQTVSRVYYSAGSNR